MVVGRVDETATSGRGGEERCRCCGGGGEGERRREGEERLADVQAERKGEFIKTANYNYARAFLGPPHHVLVGQSRLQESHRCGYSNTGDVRTRGASAKSRQPHRYLQ